MLQNLLDIGSTVFGWVVLANHHHLLLGVSELDGVSSVLKHLHGKTAREWNLEDGLVESEEYGIQFVTTRDQRTGMIVEPEMIVIPVGEFLMGCDAGADDERPVHRVFVDEFVIGCFAVTNKLYQSFIEDTGRAEPPGWNDPRFNHPEHPVTGVSWFDAIAYCDWLSDETGKLYRLPTEAEWERAARGGREGNSYTWGDEAPQLQPDYSERWITGPERVGERPANGFGLYDISENVHEWCSDWYDRTYYLDSPARNPQGPASGTRRASRGGSWRHQIKVTRVAARSSIPPEFRYSDYGFRVAGSRII